MKATLALVVGMSCGCGEKRPDFEDDTSPPRTPASTTTQANKPAFEQRAAPESSLDVPARPLAQEIQAYVDSIAETPRNPRPLQAATRASEPPDPVVRAHPNRPVALPESTDRPTPVANQPPAPAVVERIWIQPAVIRPTEPPPKVRANTGFQTPSATDRDSVQQLIGDLERHLDTHPGDLQSQLRLRYLYMSEGRSQQVLRPLANLDPDRSQFLGKVMHCLVAADRALTDPAASPHDAIAAINDLHAWAQNRAGLEIPRVALCTAIHSFGRYDPIPDDFFVAGRHERAYLYCEVKQFGREQTSDGKYRTRIAHRLELFTRQGTSVWRDQKNLEVVDVCHNRRTDFFFNRLVELPAGISPGEYILKVTVEDRIKAEVDEASIEFRVGPHDASAVDTSASRFTPR